MTPKEQAIKQAYGEYYDTYREYIDPDGWVNVHDADPPKELPRDKRYDMGAYWRPKSLKGLENNRGWVSVKDRLPDNFYDRCWIYIKGGDIEIGLWNDTEQCWDNEEALTVARLKYVTHWQPVVKPEAPVY